MGSGDVLNPPKRGVDTPLPEGIRIGDNGWLYDQDNNLVGHESVGVQKQVEQSGVVQASEKKVMEVDDRNLAAFMMDQNGAMPPDPTPPDVGVGMSRDFRKEASGEVTVGYGKGTLGGTLVPTARPMGGQYREENTTPPGHQQVLVDGLYDQQGNLVMADDGTPTDTPMAVAPQASPPGSQPVAGPPRAGSSPQPVPMPDTTLPVAPAAAPAPPPVVQSGPPMFTPQDVLRAHVQLMRTNPRYRQQVEDMQPKQAETPPVTVTFYGAFGTIRSKYAGLIQGPGVIVLISEGNADDVSYEPPVSQNPFQISPDGEQYLSVYHYGTSFSCLGKTFLVLFVAEEQNVVR